MENRCRFIIYHDDADGRCAAAIAGRAAIGAGFADVEYIPVQRPAELPDLKSYGFDRGCDDLWLLDFSFEMAEMLQLFALAAPRFYWFDHHVSVLEKLGTDSRLQAGSLAGVREVGLAACLLVWRFCHPGDAAPWAVEFIADRDVWRFYYGTNTKHFYEIYLQHDSRPQSAIWDDWFAMELGQYRDLIATGGILYGARLNGLVKMAKRLGHPVDLEALTYGRRRGRALRLNFPGSGEMGQIARDLGYDLAWCWVEVQRGGRRVRMHSLYSDTIDVAEIAAARGGGGHTGAAGFTEEV
jgi:oligoribonuclease NrnB/cAMP/cGMP phosphodiesterase (DHH superfamily)